MYITSYIYYILIKTFLRSDFTFRMHLHHDNYYCSDESTPYDVIILYYYNNPTNNENAAYLHECLR